MPGRGPVPYQDRRRRAPLRRGEWRAVPGLGWQHGRTPPPPRGLSEGTREAWRLWMGGIAAAHWTVGDLPQLRILARLYDQEERGTASATKLTDLRLLMDTLGLSFELG